MAKDVSRKFVVTRTDAAKAVAGDEKTLEYIKEVFGLSVQPSKLFAEFLFTRSNQIDPRLRIESFDMASLLMEFQHNVRYAEYSKYYNDREQKYMRKKLYLLFRFVFSISKYFPSAVYNTYLLDLEFTNSFYSWAMGTIELIFSRINPIETKLLNEFYFEGQSLYFMAKDHKQELKEISKDLENALVSFKENSNPGFDELVLIISGKLSLFESKEVPLHLFDMRPEFFAEDLKSDLLSIISTRFDYIEDYKKFIDMNE